MAGPVAGVLLREPIELEHELQIRSEIVRIATSVNYDDFWLDGSHHAEALGLVGRWNELERRPFILSLGEEYEGELDELVENGLTDVLGWIPRGLVDFSAMCNQQVDHLLLGELCLSFARMLDGIIACHGQLLHEPCLDGDSPRAPVRVRDPSGIRGTLWAHGYWTGAGTYRTSHYVDVELMQSWLSHPYFRMIK